VRALGATQSFGYYELLPQQAAVEQALTVPALSAKAIHVLGHLGTPSAQRLLATLASDHARPLAERQAAHAAFTTAVRRRGLLLTRSEILVQYDRYNQSARLDTDTQQVLGGILDVIEGPADATKSE